MSSSVIGLVLIISIVSISSSVNSKSCTLDVRSLPELAPVFITAQKSLAKNEGGLLKWKLGEKVEILCNGRENSFVAYKKKRAVIECKDNGLYVENEKGVKNIACVKENQADVLTTKKPCSKGGVLKYIGFRSADKTFVKYITVCYNDVIASPVYTYHTIWGKGTRFMKKYARPFFAIPGVPDVDCMEAYIEQKKTLRTLLGNKAGLYFRKDGVTFSRGHLTPSRDGIFKSWQVATYYYINSAPQFELVNGQNWETVEIFVREKAAKLKEEIEVYTGVSGILELAKSKNRLTPIYLQKKDENDIMPVPKWFWKIAKFEDSGIAFVTLNNPYATNIQPVCKNICESSGWNDDKFSNLNLGFTFCCTVESLMQVFSEIPAEAKVVNVLEY